MKKSFLLPLAIMGAGSASASRYFRAQLSPDGNGGGGDDEEKRKALENVKITAEQAVKSALPELVKLELGSDAAKAAIEKIAQEVVKGIKVKDFDGEDKALDFIVDAMQKQHDALAEQFKTFKSTMLESQVSSVMSALKAQFEAKKKDLEAIHKNTSGVVSLTLKAADTPISTASFGDRVIFGLREPGVDRKPLPQRFIFDIIQVMNGGPGSNPLSWVEMAEGEGAPGWQQGEGAQKPAMNWSYIEQKVTAEMIAVWTPVSRQALLNWPLLEQEIRGELSRKLYNKLDYDVINGDGTANSIFGINYYATNFDAGSLAGTIERPNRLDVIRVAIGQVKKGAPQADPLLGGFQANFAIIGVDAGTAIDLEKNANGTYLLPPFVSADNTRVKGVTLIETNFIGDDDFIVGDFSRYLFNIVDGLKIDVGYINNYFIRNLLAVRAEMYGMGRVKNHEKPAFVKGNFEDAIAELEATT